MPETTGVAHESLSTQIVLPVMFSLISRSVSRSSGVPSPATIRSSQALDRARGHEQGGRIARAMTAYEQALADEPENVDALHGVEPEIEFQIMCGSEVGWGITRRLSHDLQAALHIRLIEPFFFVVG